MLLSNNDQFWFAMSTPYGNELKAKEYLDRLNITSFIPMSYAISEKRGRKERKLVPAVRNLLFVYAKKEAIQQAKLRFKYLQYHTKPEQGRNVPIVVPDEQMKHFIAIASTNEEHLKYFSSSEINFAKGTKVRIHGGSLDGVEGVFVKIKGLRSKRVVVSIDGIVNITADVHPDLIEVIE